MRRRDLLAVIAGTVARPLPGRAQSTATTYRIGFLGNSTPELEANLIGPFRDGLRRLGYREGQNLTIEYRWAEGNYARFPALVAELIALDVAVIVTAGTPATLAVKKATRSVPLVMVAVGDPVGTGIVPSLSRPGGNITGLSSMAPDLEAKRLELLREVMPTLSRTAVMWNPLNPFHELSLRQVNAAARKLHLKIQPVEVRKTEDLEAACASLLKGSPEALVILADRVFLHDREPLVRFSLENHLPGIYAYRELVTAGGLMSYGPSYEDMHRRAALYVDRILKGAKPANLPIEQPTKFDLFINLTAAKTLGLTFPASILARADEAVE